MRQAAREKRKQAIEEAALSLLQEAGYDGMSMLSVAKRAKASNETLYRWYGDKTGLFKSLVERNSAIIKAQIPPSPLDNQSAVETLRTLGLVLLKVLTGPTAVALNRAAASDASGELGSALADAGRHAVLPALSGLVKQAQAEGFLANRPAGDAARLFVSVFIGDLQIRLVTRAIPAMSDAELADRAAWAWNILTALSREDTGK